MPKYHWLLSSEIIALNDDREAIDTWASVKE